MSESVHAISTPALNDSDPARIWRQRAIGAAGIIVLVLLAYLPVIMSGGWIWDDDSYVTGNPHLRTLEGLSTMWMPGNTPQYYPLVFTTFWIEYHLWGLDPQGFHIVNVLLHMANALLLWGLLAKIRVPGSWLIAAVFALHPVHVESVAWVTERKNVLSLFFYLLAASSYLTFDRMRDALPTERRRECWGWYALAVLLYAAALLSKTVTASLPVALLLVMLWQRPWREVVLMRRLLPLAPMFVIGLGLGLHTAYLERTLVGATGDAFDFTFIERLLIASKVTLFYPWKIIWPEPLIFFYPRWTIDQATVASYWSIAVCAAIAATCVWAFVRGWRGPVLALAFFVVTIFPAMGFFNVWPFIYSFVADHFQYHASIGTIVLIGGSAAWLARHRPRVLIAPATVVLVLLFAQTWRHGAIYRDADTVWRDTIAKNPDAWAAHNNLASSLLTQAQHARAAGDDAAARERLHESLDHTTRSLEANPENLSAYTNHGEALRMLGRADEAVPYFRYVVDNAPVPLPRAYFNLGRALYMVGDHDEARRWHEQATEAAPSWPRPHEELGRIAIAAEDFETAITRLERVAALDPTDTRVWETLCALAEQLGRYRDAERYFRSAVDGVPDDRSRMLAMSRLAFFLATCPDTSVRRPREAVDIALRLVSLSERRDPMLLHLLAVAFESAGDESRARAVAAEALARAEEIGGEVFTRHQRALEHQQQSDDD